MVLADVMVIVMFHLWSKNVSYHMDLSDITFPTSKGKC